MKSIIVAYDKQRGIGVNGDLPWGRGLPADLRNFRELTLDKTVIMGRKTYDSIGMPLPKRENIVISRQKLQLPESVKCVSTIEEAYATASHDIFVIGGASLYAQTLPDVDVVYATEVDAVIDGTDTFFPSLEGGWHETSRIHHPKDEKNNYAFDFVTYQRATPQSVL